MAFFSKKKHREYSGPPQFYVEFLGCLPCRGVRGNIYTNPVALELIERQKQYPDVPKMTLQVTPNEIKFRYKHQEDNRKDKTSTAKYPAISMEYVMYVSLMNRPNDSIANCIYLSYNPNTLSMLHTHVYRFDSPSTAATFVKLINRVVESSQHQSQVTFIEERLRQDGYLQTVVEKPPPQSEYIEKVQGSPTMTAPPEIIEDPEPEDDYISPEKQNMLALASELREKLQLRKGPILLPPKDYDTVHRKQGRLDNISSRKCLNEIIVGHSSVEAVASATGDMSILNEQNEENEPNNIYYPAKQSPEAETVYPPTSVGSPPIMRRKEKYIRRTESFLSSSSDKDRYYQAASYAAPSPNSPSPVTNRRPVSDYESYPTLKSPERSPINVSNPDIFRYKKPQHTRESSMSSTHSGLSSHSDHSQRLSQVLDDGNLEIPPDYDETPKKGKHGKRLPKDEHLGYNNVGNQKYYDPHRPYERQGPIMVNANPQYNPQVQPRQDPSELYSKPIKRIAPVQR